MYGKVCLGTSTIFNMLNLNDGQRCKKNRQYHRDLQTKYLMYYIRPPYMSCVKQNYLSSLNWHLALLMIDGQSVK